MKIAFAKVGRHPAEFRYAQEGLSIEGTLERVEAHRVELRAGIEGEVELECDRCGESFREEIKIPLELHLSDRPLLDAQDLDTIEFLDGSIDIASLLRSEIASHRSSYHYCPRCSGEDREIDLEY